MPNALPPQRGHPPPPCKQAPRNPLIRLGPEEACLFTCKQARHACIGAERFRGKDAAIARHVSLPFHFGGRMAGASPPCRSSKGRRRGPPIYLLPHPFPGGRKGPKEDSNIFLFRSKIKCQFRLQLGRGPIEPQPWSDGMQARCQHSWRRVCRIGSRYADIAKRAEPGSSAAFSDLNQSSS